jgi:hypothetical protein
MELRSGRNVGLSAGSGSNAASEGEAEQPGSARPHRTPFSANPTPNPFGAQPAGVNPFGQPSRTIPNPIFTPTPQPPGIVSAGVTAPRANLPKVSDLPKYKGYGVDGSDARSFFISIQDLFDLYQVDSHNRVLLIGQAFPHSTPASLWYQSCRVQGLFGPGTQLDWATFERQFAAKFTTPESRKFALLRLYKDFTQKCSLDQHRVNFDKLLMQLAHVGIQYTVEQNAYRYLDSLYPDLRAHIELKHTVTPNTLEGVHAAAQHAQDALAPTRARAPAAQSRAVALQSLIAPRQYHSALTAAVHDNSSRPSPTQNSDRNSTKWCMYHKKCNHSSKECKKIPELHAQGKWKGPWPIE